MTIVRRVHPVTRIILSFILISIVVGAVSLRPTKTAFAASLTVNTTDDLNDGVCDTAHCSLREAIIAANALSDVDTIGFDIAGPGPHTIAPTTALPNIVYPTIIDGTSEPNYTGVPVVELSGANAGADVSGLVFLASNNVVRGLVVNRWDDFGVSFGLMGAPSYDSDYNTLQGSYIGTDVTGSVAAPNRMAGVILFGSNESVIGGSTLAERNVISGNAWYGGIWIQGTYANRNWIKGNIIGLDATGTYAIPNTYGIYSAGGFDGIIGGGDASEANIISGNTYEGIWVSMGRNIDIERNYIGTDGTGSIDLGNGHDGIDADNASGIVAFNVISGNGWNGISMSPNATGLYILGNTIGLDTNGTFAIGNGHRGISSSTPDCNIGGWYYDPITGWAYEGNHPIGGAELAAVGNLISGNGEEGIYLSGNYCLVVANGIGVNIEGTAALGNGAAGIHMISDHSRIGNDGPEGNLISGNHDQGVKLNSLANDNIIIGNFIGTDISGQQPLGNGMEGVLITYGSQNNTIGGSTPDAYNNIAFNGGDGVSITPVGTWPTLGNNVQANNIWANGGLGIDLWPDGVTANDAGDAETGMNNLQNYPVITLADSNGTVTTVSGTLNSAANSTFRLDFFSNASCDASGYGEGEHYLGSTSVVTDASGNASFNVTLDVASASGSRITATATDAGGNTSEFSACAMLASDPTPTPTSTPTPTPTPSPTPAPIPGTPLLVSPANGARVSSRVFTWSTASDAVQYRIQIDNNSNFSSPEANAVVSGTSYTATLVKGTYYWRVQGVNIQNASGPWSSIWSVILK